MKNQIIDFDFVSFEMVFWENCLPKRFISATTSNPNDDNPWLLATSEPVSAVVESALYIKQNKKLKKEPKEPKEYIPTYLLGI